MIKVALFDIDGVVIVPKLMFSKNYCKQFDINYRIMDEFFRGPFYECTIGKADLKEIIKPYLSDWKWPGETDGLLDYWFKSENSIDINVVKIIKELQEKGIKCCLASNQEKYRKQYMLREMGFKDIFDNFYFSVDLGACKPDLKFYEIVFQKLNKDMTIDKKEIIFFDDGEKEIEAGKKFGFNSCLYKNIESLKKDLEFYNI